MTRDERRQHRIEFLATVLLAIAAVATAWSTYQSARWRGEQASDSAKATAAHIASAQASTRAGQLTQVDIATFVQWFDADVAGDMKLADFYRRRFRKEFRPAFVAWIATRPRTDVAAPLTPFAMRQYRLAEEMRAERLNAAAGMKADVAGEANQRAGNYVGAVVLFAVALFFAGMATKLRSPRKQEVLLGLGWVVFLGTAVWVATFPSRSNARRAARECAPPRAGELTAPAHAGRRGCAPPVALRGSRAVAQTLTAPVEGPDSASPVIAPAPAGREPPGVDNGLLQLKIRPAPLRPELVSRERLVQRLLDAQNLPVALIVAPAGYGKTTLLSQWSERDERPFAWVNLDAEDNDPKNLLSAIALALDAVEPIGWEIFEALTSGRPEAASVAHGRLARSLGRREVPVVLALDNLHVLRTRESREVVTTIWQVFGAGLQLALASRSDPVLPIGRLRAHGNSVELRAEDMAMTRSEASMLLHLAGLELAPEQALSLARRTEGWPAGLHLAALSLREQWGDHPDIEAFAGDDRFVAEYVREELLSGLPPAELEFLTRTSVLERLSAPLCDAILERHDSADLLQRLARSNVLLTPLDRRDRSYRYPELFAKVLQAELRRREPGRDAELHRRASVWCAEHGDTDGAVGHAIEAQDLERAGRLLWDSALEHAARGEHSVILGWLERFTDAELAGTPVLALVAAGTSLMAGNLYEAERWTALAARVPGDLDVVQAGVALMRAAVGRRRAAEMGASAAHAHALLGETSPWGPLCRLLQGVALHMTGERDEARHQLQEGAHRAAASAPMVQALCLAQLSLLAAEENDLERWATLAERATAQVRRCRLDGCPTVALPLAVSAEVRAQRGQVAEATSEIRQALALLTRTTDASPWYEAECRIVLARATLRLNEPAAAGELLDEAGRALGRVPDARVLRDWLDEAIAQVHLAMSSTAGADWSLTTAELRVLRFLPSHLSFREIADRLYVSPNTVKTHVRGIYRKLGVSSRANAVDRARGAGLVDCGVGA